MMHNTLQTTSNTRFGASFDAEANHINFSLFSINGTAALLCLFDKSKGKDAVLTVKMTKNDNAFEANINPSDIKWVNVLKGEPLYYGFRVFGSNYEYTESWSPGNKDGFKTKRDELNNRFNPNKLAYDPYAKELSHLHIDIDPKLENFRSNEKYFEDNQKIAPKSIFKINPDIEIIKTSKRALNDEIIGEVHIKSLTMLSDNVDAKGTFKGAGEFAKYVKSLGITMIEFLPVFEFDDKEDIGNYWGYMPLCYFALHKKYAFNKKDGEAIVEFREMINALHKEDIKVCLDVVYNHTGEARIYNGNPDDVNLFSYALIDNQSYYKSDKSGFYAANSGCHNDSNTAGIAFKNIIVDSLEYWIKQGVDAFRFDLATSLMDTKTDSSVYYDKNHSIVGDLKNRLEERDLKVNLPDEAADGINLIAEPWTCSGYNAYQLGNFPEFFAEWNDVSRNTLRAFSVRPKNIDFLSLKNLIKGTPQKFNNPSESINYVSCHDGFTLWDLNSYDKKAPGTCGGSDWELCSSYGGDKNLRNKAIRNQTALLMLSSGCPMMQVDDILLHSKGGNNNSYNIDGLVNYINYDLTEEKQALSLFIKSLIDFRKSHKIFKSRQYVENMEFYGHLARPFPDFSPFWTLTDMNFMSFATNDEEKSIFVAINKGNNNVKFILPRKTFEEKKNYYIVFDTKNNEFNPDGVLYKPDKEEPGQYENEHTYTIEPHTIVLMLIKD